MGLPRPAKKGELVAIDIEMFGMTKLHRPTGRFASLQVSYANQETVWLITDEHDIPAVLERLKLGTWVFHNALFDIRVLQRFTSVPQRQVWDTMVIEQDLFGGYYRTFSLADLARRWLGVLMLKDERAGFIEGEDLTPAMKEYAAFDAYYTVRIAEKQKQYAIDEDEDLSWYWEIDEHAIWAILDMPGVRINVEGWLDQADIMARMGREIELELDLNVNSHAIVKDRIEKVTGTRPESTNAKKILEPLSRGFRRDGNIEAADYIDLILEARRYRKAAETYGVSFLDQHLEDDGRVYSSYWVTGAMTGRTASSNPNLQNIKKDPEYRKLFIASKGNRMLVSDVNQQEVRFLCALAKDKNMLAIFQAGLNIHKQTQLDLQDAGADIDYKGAKAINLGTGYGLTGYGLSRDTGIPRDEADDFVEAFFEARPHVASWIDRTRGSAKRLGVVRTLSGRPVHINPHGGWHADNEAINSPVQGSAADQLKLTMRLIRERVRSAGIQFGMVLLPHDEVVVDVQRGTMAEQKDIVDRSWKDAADYLAPGVPFEVDTKTGFNWGVRE